MKITRRKIEKEFGDVLALLKRNPTEQIEVLDRRGQTLFFVHLSPCYMSNVPIAPVENVPIASPLPPAQPEPQHTRREAFLKLKHEIESKEAANVPIKPVQSGPKIKKTGRHVFGHVERSDVKYTNSFGA